MALCPFCLPGMILLPGSFSGNISSPNPQRGPEPKNLMSLAIFIRLQAMTFKVPLTSTIQSFVANASNLLVAVVKGKPATKKREPILNIIKLKLLISLKSHVF